MRNKFYYRAAFLVFILSILSFYIKINFNPFVKTLGTYEGDLWYFYTYYGKYIVNNFFFPIEYPVGFIIIQKLTSFISINLLRGFVYDNFIVASSFLMIPATLATVLFSFALAKQIKNKVEKTFLYIILSPTFLIAQSTNYDILPSLSVVSSLYFLFRKNFITAFLILGIGTAIKIYPIFLLPLFILVTMSQKVKPIILLKNSLVFLTPVILINLPFALKNFQFFLFPYQYQSQNPQRNDPNTLSYYFSTDLLLPLLVIIAIGLSIFAYRKKKLTEKNTLMFALFTIFSVLVGNHVNTPQYLLWVLPLVAILQIPKLSLWWIFDLSNSSILYFYFKLHNELSKLLIPIFSFNLTYFIVIYYFLLIKIFGVLRNEKN